jgi:alpha-amylase
MGESVTDEIHLIDEWFGIDIGLFMEQSSVIWRFPIETVSQSEGGFERVYQSSVLLPNWRLNLSPEQSWRTKMVLKIKTF